MIKGSIVALVTPMQENGSIDFAAFEALLDWHVDNKTDGIVVLGTTGESPTVHDEERIELIKLTVKHAKKRYPVIVGTGSNATDHTIELTKQAKELGADACLIVTPYYNKPTQEGLFQHYKAIAEAVDIPIIMYNVPGRTACDLKAETVVRLSQFKNICGIKDCSNELERIQIIRNGCGQQFLIYTGNDDNSLDFMLQGGDGVISVTANLAPQKMHEMCQAALNGEKEQATKLNDALNDLHINLFLEANPIPTKWCLSRMKKIPTGIRLPLTTLSATHQLTLENILNKAGLLS